MTRNLPVHMNCPYFQITASFEAFLTYNSLIVFLFLFRFFYFLGFSRMVLKNSEVFVMIILSVSGFVTGRLAYNFIEVLYT